jgi:hypothetical protein
VQDKILSSFVRDSDSRSRAARRTLQPGRRKGANAKCHELGSLPLRVLSHDPKLGPSPSRAIDRKLHKLYPDFEHLWTEGQAEIAALSTVGTHHAVPNA